MSVVLYLENIKSFILNLFCLIYLYFLVFLNKLDVFVIDVGFVVILFFYIKKNFEMKM